MSLQARLCVFTSRQERLVARMNVRVRDALGLPSMRRYAPGRELRLLHAKQASRRKSGGAPPHSILFCAVARWCLIARCRALLERRDG